MERLPAKSFEDLIVWKKTRQFVLMAYIIPEKFPKQEMFGLTSQLRRVSVSIAANIAEGFKKKERADKARFLNIAEGSLEECRYYLLLIHDLNYGEFSELKKQIEEVSKLIHAYSKAIQNSAS